MIAQRLVVTEELAEPYPEPQHPAEQDEIEQIVEESGSRFTRRRLLTLGGAARRRTLGLAALVAPAPRSARCSTRARSRARRGGAAGGSSTGRAAARARDDDRAGDASTRRSPRAPTVEQLGAPLVVVRLEPAARAADDRAGWAPDGIVAYSKICTHAGCAVALYRKPTFPDRSRSRRSSARATTRRSTRRPAARCCSGRRAARCRSCRSSSTATATCARPATSPARSGPSWSGVRRSEARHVIRARRPLRRRARRRGAVRAQGAALRLPRPLVVPARRGRALLLRRPRRDRHLPDAVLRAEHARRSSTTARTRRCRATTMSRGVPVGAATSRST